MRKQWDKYVDAERLRDKRRAGTGTWKQKMGWNTWLGGAGKGRVVDKKCVCVWGGGGGCVRRRPECGLLVFPCSHGNGRLISPHLTATCFLIPSGVTQSHTQTPNTYSVQCIVCVLDGW